MIEFDLKAGGKVYISKAQAISVKAGITGYPPTGAIVETSRGNIEVTDTPAAAAAKLS